MTKFKNIFCLILILRGDVSFCVYDDFPPEFEPIEKKDMSPQIYGVEEEANSYWRSQMNHWYDQCAKYNNEADGMPLGDKIKLFLENKKLEDYNSILNEELKESFPNLCNLNYKDLCSLESKKRMEFWKIRDQLEKNKPEDKINAEIATLQKELKELDNTYKELHDECENNCYIPSDRSKHLSPIEEKKIELEKECHSLQIELLEKKVEEKELVIQKQKAKNEEFKKRGRELLKDIRETLDIVERRKK